MIEFKLESLPSLTVDKLEPFLASMVCVRGYFDISDNRVSPYHALTALIIFNIISSAFCFSLVLMQHFKLFLDAGLTGMIFF